MAAKRLLSCRRFDVGGQGGQTNIGKNRFILVVFEYFDICLFLVTPNIFNKSNRKAINRNQPYITIKQDFDIDFY